MSRYLSYCFVISRIAEVEQNVSYLILDDKADDVHALLTLEIGHGLVGLLNWYHSASVVKTA